MEANKISTISFYLKSKNMNDFFKNLIINILLALLKKAFTMTKPLFKRIKVKALIKRVNAFIAATIIKFLNLKIAHLIVAFLVLSCVSLLLAGGYLVGVHFYLINTEREILTVWLVSIIYLAGYAAWLANSFYKDYCQSASISNLNY